MNSLQLHKALNLLLIGFMALNLSAYSKPCDQEKQCCCSGNDADFKIGACCCDNKTEPDETQRGDYSCCGSNSIPEPINSGDSQRHEVFNILFFRQDRHLTISHHTMPAGRILLSPPLILNFPRYSMPLRI
jgi:hypothetical protein